MMLILGGTHECVEVADVLKKHQQPFVLSVATAYGAAHYKAYADHIQVGPMDLEALKAFIAQRGIQAVIDVTHPHAHVVKNNAKAACDAVGIPYYGFVRELTLPEDLDGFVVVPDMAAAIDAVKMRHRQGDRIFITGMKHIAQWCNVFDKEHLYFRVMPSYESIKACEGHGVLSENIVAIKRAPQLLNNALLEAYNMRFFVFKNSGAGSAFNSNYLAVKAHPETVGIIVSPTVDTTLLTPFKSREALRTLIEQKILEA